MLSSLTFDSAGQACLLTMPSEQVYALVDLEGSGTKVQLHTLLTGQVQPNGVAWHNGSLYVAEVGQITRYDRADAYALAGLVRIQLLACCSRQTPCSIDLCAGVRQTLQSAEDALVGHCKTLTFCRLYPRGR